MPLGVEIVLGQGDIVLDGDPQFAAHVCGGQTPEWIKMPLDTGVGLGQATLCLMGTQLPPPKKKAQ